MQKLTNDISETRTGVTDVKCFIDGMRTSRDTKMKDMADLKAKLKDQNQRLLQVTQEKAKVETGSPFMSRIYNAILEYNNIPSQRLFFKW